MSKTTTIHVELAGGKKKKGSTNRSLSLVSIVQPTELHFHLQILKVAPSNQQFTLLKMSVT